MAPGSLVGFLLVFVLVSWSLGAVGTSLLRLSSARLAAWGPAAEKRAAASTIAGPVLLAGAVTASIGIYSAAPQLFGSVDHCGAHGHHLHLCLVHGGAWVGQIWAAVGGAALLALFAVRAVRLVSAVVGGRRRVRILERSSIRVSHALPQLEAPAVVFVAPSSRDFCFAIGYLRPRIFISSALWQRLDAAKRDAVLAHEVAHIENRDLWRSLFLSACGVFGAPFSTERLRTRWNHATEMLCDRLAADRIGDPAAVAETLVSWARGPVLAPGLSFFSAEDALEERVVAVLSEQPSGESAAHRMRWSGAVALLGVTVLVFALVDPIHHALETLFGLGFGTGTL